MNAPQLKMIVVEGFECERCHHVWVPRHKNTAPKVCPSCKSPYWDRPRRDHNAPSFGCTSSGMQGQ